MEGLVHLLARQTASPGSTDVTPTGTIPPNHNGRFSTQMLSRIEVYTPLMIGAWLDATMMGLTVVMFSLWWIKTRRMEKAIFRYLVYWLAGTSAAGSGWFAAFILSTLAANFGDSSQFTMRAYLRWYSLIVLFSRIPAMLSLAALFLLHRAYLFLDRKKWIVVLTSPMMYVANILFGLVAVVRATLTSRAGVAGANIAYVAVLRTIADAALAKRLLAVEAGLEALVSITLAGIIGLGLRWPKSGIAKTDERLSKVLRVLVETQLPQAAVTIAFFLIALTLPNTPAQFYVLFYPKISPILIMLVLTAREPMQLETRPEAFSGARQQEVEEEYEVPQDNEFQLRPAEVVPVIQRIRIPDFDATQPVQPVEKKKKRKAGSRRGREGGESDRETDGGGSKVHLV